MRPQPLNTKPFFHGLMIFSEDFFYFCLMKKSEFPKVPLYLFLDQLMHFIPGIANDTPFRGIISAILHFNFLGFKPQKERSFSLKKLSLSLLYRLFYNLLKKYFVDKNVVFSLTIIQDNFEGMQHVATFKNVRRAKILFFL